MSEIVVIENYKTRGKNQFFWYFCIVLFFLFGIASLYYGIVFLVDPNYYLADYDTIFGIFLTVFFLFGGTVLIFFFVLSLLLSVRYIVLLENKIIAFTGFGKYKIHCNNSIQIVFALLGSGTQYTCGCLIFKNGLKICEYQLSMGNSGERETQLLIEEKMNYFAEKTGCTVYYQWFVRAKDVMRRLGLKNKRIKKKDISS